MNDKITEHIKAFKGYVVKFGTGFTSYLWLAGLISDKPVEMKAGWSAICAGIFLVIFFIAKKERR